MRRNIWMSITAALSFMVAAAAFMALGTVPAAADNSMWGANYFPNVPLTNQYGKTLRFYDDVLKGKIVVIDLIYTHCVDSCPLETARLAQVQRLLGDRVGREIFFYSISIDPQRDTPAQLRAYAAKYHVKPGWQFLTGKKSDIELISKKLGLYSDPDPSNRDGHTPAVLIGNEATGQWIKNSATDNPKYLAVMIGDWMNSWKNLTAGATSGKSYTEAADHLSIDRGKYIFSSQCAACHTIGQGDNIGPDLLGVTNVRSTAWLTRFIQAPDKVLAQHDPVAIALFKRYKGVQMPNLRVNNSDTAAVIGFLKKQSAVASQEPSKDIAKTSGGQ